MANFNKIQIARGLLSKRTDPLYGELFYDKVKKSVFIGAPKEADPASLEWRRIGGFGTMTLRGMVNKATWDTIKESSKEGDAYIVSEKIPVTKKEPYFKKDGNEFIEDYDTDDFLKPGEIIVFSYVKNIKASNAVSFPSGTWISVSGGNDAVEIEMDVSKIDSLSEDDSRNLQINLDRLFNNKTEYIGTRSALRQYNNKITKPGITVSPLYETINDYLEDEFAHVKAGQFFFYENSIDNTDEVVYIYNESEPEKYVKFTLRRNSLIFKKQENYYDSATPNKQSYQIIWLGSKEVENFLFSFSGIRKSTEAFGNVQTKDKTGANLNITNDAEVETLQQAIDVLHQTKADLNAQGKIPLSQIPKTLTGVLQYCGGISFENPPEMMQGTPPDDTSTYQLTNEQLVAAIAKIKDPDAWEKPNEGEVAQQMFDSLDEGDYIIINKVEITTTKVNENDDNYKLLVKNNFITNVIVPGSLDPKKRSSAIIFINGDGQKQIVNKGDWIVVKKKDGAGLVYFDVINNSSSVDAVNSLTGNVTIVGTKRIINNQVLDTANEVVISVKENNIVVNAPDMVMSKGNLDVNRVLVGDARIDENGHEKAGKEVKTSELGVKNHTSVSGTILIGKDKDNQNVEVELNKSGNMVIGNGDENFHTMWAPGGRSIVNSKVKDTLSHTQTGDNFAIHHSDATHMFKVNDNGESFYAFDNDNRTGREARNTRMPSEKVLLDDTSIIDGGVY